MNSDLVPWILSCLRMIHFGGIILGIGAATLLDLIIFRFAVSKVILEEHISVVVFSSHIITIGLALLWFSGIGFFVYYWFFDPVKMLNPKLLAKIIIVGVLTFNAFLVHYFVLPQFTIQIGQRLLEGLSRFHRFLMILIGTISIISWYAPLILGIVPQFNKVIPAELILMYYAILIVFVNVILQTVLVIKFYVFDR